MDSAPSEYLGKLAGRSLDLYGNNIEAIATWHRQVQHPSSSGDVFILKKCDVIGCVTLGLWSFPTS